jgi:hypothetical protein
MRHPATGVAGLDNVPIGCHKTTQRMGRKQGIRRSFVPCNGYVRRRALLSEKGETPSWGRRFLEAVHAAFDQFNEET